MRDTFLLAGRFGAATRLSPKALRLYAEQGLLTPAYVDPASGYRYYAAEQAPRARLIARLRRLGLPLTRVAQLVDLVPQARAVELRAWLAAEHERLAGQVALIEAMTRQDQGGEPALIDAIAIRAVPATKIVYRQRTLGVGALDGFIAQSHAAIRAHLRASGLRDDGRMSAIFHDCVNHDSEGRVEVAVAYEGRVEPDGDLRLRLQPARREAFLPVPAGHEDFPWVQRVYDALDTWLDARADLLCDDSPCETYPGTGGARFDVVHPITA